jgi:putative pyridoxal-dependent aspartate 1-decarboxylase
MNREDIKAHSIDLDHVLCFFDPNSRESRALREHLGVIAHKFLQSEQTSSPGSSGLVRENLRDTSMPEDALPSTEYLEYLERNIVSQSVNVACPRFIGHMTSSLPCFMQDMGRLMLTLNQNTVKLETAKSLTYLERQVLGMLHRFVYHFEHKFYEDHVQVAESTLGMITSGGTVANATALWCARNKALPADKAFGGVELEGLPAGLRHHGYCDSVIIGSSLMHYSLEKSAGLLGCGTRGLIRVPVNERHQVDLNALKKILSERKRRGDLIIALVGVAGTTDSGAVDPLPEMAEMASEYGTHFHVDAAWGGPLLFSRQHASKLAGIERADSVTIDAHKQLYVPMGVGTVLLRDPYLAGHIEKKARYIARPGTFDLGRRSLEGSRPGMVLLLHAALHLIGRRGYEVLIDEGVRKAQYLVRTIAERSQFEVLVPPAMNIVVYRYLPRQYRTRCTLRNLSEQDQAVINDANESLQRMQRRAGITFVSRTSLEWTTYGHTVPLVALRAVLANPLTTQGDIDAVLDEQVRLGNALPSVNESRH